MITCYVWMTGFGNFSFFYVKRDFGWLRVVQMLWRLNFSTDSVVGATNGSVWEYYFRTSLDHWSSYLGMIFALNYPLAEQYFQRCQGGPLYVASFLSGVSMSLHDLGKTTLETYLLQHHIWLTSNAKTLLTIIPGHPWVNFALATILFFTVAKELYRLTMSLRGMILPDDNRISFNNLLIISAIMLVTFDAFLGIGFLSLALFCKSFDWESVYLPLHRKLGLEFTLHEESSKDELFENENLIEEIFRTASKDKI
eukprot:gene18679-24426_t